MGGFNGISKVAEARISDLLSVHHVNSVHFSDDLATIVSNVAQSLDWNTEFAEVTFSKRKYQLPV
jgi:hypothetical protein